MMKNIMANAAIAVLCFSGSAIAADVIVPKPAPSVPVVDTSSIWDGFYGGLNVGYGQGAFSDEDGLFPDVDASEVNGIFGGAQIGYNIDAGGFVFGVEADIQATNMSQTLDPTGDGDMVVGLDYFGTVRARAGVAFDQFLPYVTGGFAYGQGHIDATDVGLWGSDSQIHTGWTAGAGAEYAATESVSIKAEYLYFDLGNQTYDLDPGPEVSGSFDAHTVRIGANFHF